MRNSNKCSLKVPRFFDCLGNYLFTLYKEDASNFELYHNQCIDIIAQYSGASFKTLSEATLHRIKGEYQPAIEKYNEYIEESGFNNKTIGYEMSEAYRMSGDIDKAIEVLDQLLLSDPHQPLYLLEQTRNYIAKKDKAKAKELIGEVMDLFKEADKEYQGYKEALEVEKRSVDHVIFVERAVQAFTYIIGCLKISTSKMWGPHSPC